MKSVDKDAQPGLTVGELIDDLEAMLDEYPEYREQPVECQSADGTFGPVYLESVEHTGDVYLIFDEDEDAYGLDDDGATWGAVSAAQRKGFLVGAALAGFPAGAIIGFLIGWVAR